MNSKIGLIVTDFDGTLVSYSAEPVFNHECMEFIREFQHSGGIWAISTGRSVDVLQTCLKASCPIHPNFILTSERDVFRRAPIGLGWEAYGDWNERSRNVYADLFTSESPVLAELVDFVSRQAKARVIYQDDGTTGIYAESEAEIDLITHFIDEVRTKEPKLGYQRNTACLRLCHVDYHKGAVLAELSRLLGITREQVFAAGDHHNDIPMLNGCYAKYPSCPANAIPELKEIVARAGGYVAQTEYGAGVYEALLHFVEKL